jgi:UDP-N-acetylglucosamine--N-acetylmuramyl-(pentapeptide) pyrophosphoryl-undecaprenol N-acetylglucosamine transferase
MVSKGATRDTRRIGIVGGGTAGHVYPALAVAAAYREILPQAQITFFGTRLGIEGTLVPQAGYALEIVPGSPLFGVGAAGKLRAARNAVGGMRASGRIFERAGIQGLLSFGGYASAGPVLAARRAGIAIAVCEPNVAPGLSNRLLARFADSIFLGSGRAAAAFARKSTVTGVPVRISLRGARPYSGALHTPRRVLVLGGSLGSSFLNQRAPQALARLQASGFPLEVRHQAGASQAQHVARLYADLGMQAEVEGFAEDIGPLYAWADLAVTCAGAITLAELAVAGLPAFVVPLAVASEDHQSANAEVFFETTGCPWLRERDWDDARVAEAIGELLSNEAHMRWLMHRLLASAKPDAAAVVARAFEDLIAAHP